jgi:hypothetical protein
MPVLTFTWRKSPHRTRRALLSGAVVVAALGTGLVAPATSAEAAAAACTAGTEFRDPHRVASNNTVRAGFRLSTNCGGKASMHFWVNGPVETAADEYWNFQPGGGSYGHSYVVGKCRPGTYQAFLGVVYAAADGTSIELSRKSNRITIKC